MVVRLEQRLEQALAEANEPRQQIFTSMVFVFIVSMGTDAIKASLAPAHSPALKLTAVRGKGSSDASSFDLKNCMPPNLMPAWKR